MDKIFIFGHKKPDTDTVTSSIALSYLKNKLGYNSEARVLGPINKETKFVLDYFKVKEPKYLNDVKLQLKDLNYHRNYFLNENTSVSDVYNFLMDKNITGIPIVDSNNKFKGLVTLKTIFKELLNSDQTLINTSFDNLTKVLKANTLVKFDDEIEGNILAATYRSTTFLENLKLDNKTILIVGDRHSVIEYAVNSGIKLLIIVGDNEIKEEHIEIARKNKVNIIRTSLDSFHTAKLIGLSNYIKNLITEDSIETFDENDYYDDFLIKSSKLGHNNYPIIDKKGICHGLIRITEITEKNRKKCILVDHNEAEQSVLGLDEAEILEIVDHHKIGDLTTNQPINFRNMTVGSTNTIIYSLYKESKIEIPKEIAGLMISGILSDTLALTSPTTTELDKFTVNELSRIIGFDYTKYASEMFKAGTSLEGKTKEEIVNEDIKIFPVEDKKFAVSQVFTLNYEEILNEKDKYIEIIEEIKINKECELVLLCVTDIIKNGSYILYTKDNEEQIGLAFNIKDIEQGYYLSGYVSRKKQLVPNIMDIIK
ncbi:MAG: putative manganese-dependent inorganic diphosphatase [Bacilli bacterium]|nr:putative manganese-dependent inorganic diphosphatase [Bacilli bacterium]